MASYMIKEETSVVEDHKTKEEASVMEIKETAAREMPSDGNLKCSQSPPMFDFNIFLQENLAPARAECRLSCDKKGCNYVAENLLGLIDHDRIHAKPYQCDFCGKRFTKKLLIAEHILSSHTKIGCFVCHVCDKRFYIKKNLMIHLKTHKKIFECPDCPVKERTKRELQIHYIFKHMSKIGKRNGIIHRN